LINNTMKINIKLVAEKAFNILKGLGYAVNSYGSDGKQIVDPEQATRFVINKPSIKVHIDAETTTIRLESGEPQDQLHQMLKNLAQNTGMYIDYKIFGKSIKPKESTTDNNSLERDMAEVMEGFGSMTGSVKTSYQPLDNVRLVVKHRKPVSEEVRGARSRNIHSIYIQRGEERFKLPETNLAAARAMARHVQMGGEVYDTVGESISNMAADYRKLNEFVRYVRSARLVNESNQDYVQLAVESINDIRTKFKRLSGFKTYQSTVESLNQETGVEILEDQLDLQGAFTETHFDNRVANVLDTLKTLTYKQKAFESEITKAIRKESFSNLKDMLQETDVVEFETPQSKLSHQVSKLGYAANDPRLSGYLQSISQKINTGGKLNQFEYGTIKSCLLSANQTKSAPTSGDFNVTESYVQFLNQFDL